MQRKQVKDQQGLWRGEFFFLFFVCLFVFGRAV